MCKLILFLSACGSLAAASPHDLVISGAGPAGLTSGIAALMAGTERVRVVEKRAADAWASRHRSVFLSDRTVQTLGALGVEIPATPITTWHIVRNGRQRILPNAGHWKDEIFAEIFHAKYNAIVRIGDLERNLLARYRALGGEIEFGATVDPVALARTADLVVIAEGARSASRERLGITSGPAGVGTDPVYLSVDFQTPPGTAAGSFYFFIDQRGRLEGYGCRADGYGSFGLIHPDLLDPAAQTARLHAMAAQIGITPADFVNVYRYVGRLNLARVIRSGRTVLIGDAARTTDPTSSSGLNTAIKDAVAVAEFATDGERDVLIARIAAHTRETFAHALYFQNLIGWGNLTLRRLWGLAPVGQRLDPAGGRRVWSVHDGYFYLGSLLPRGLQAWVTAKILRIAGGPRPVATAALPTHACASSLED